VTTSAKDGSSFNRYAYPNKSPYKHKDRDGRIAETLWDGSGGITANHTSPAVAKDHYHGETQSGEKS
jgi:hypothetical protein